MKPITINAKDRNVIAAMYKILVSQEFRTVVTYCRDRNCDECALYVPDASYNICEAFNIPINLNTELPMYINTCKEYLQDTAYQDAENAVKQCPVKRLSKFLKRK